MARSRDYRTFVGDAPSVQPDCVPIQYARVHWQEDCLCYNAKYEEDGASITEVPGTVNGSTRSGTAPTFMITNYLVLVYSMFAAEKRL